MLGTSDNSNLKINVQMGQSQSEIEMVDFETNLRRAFTMEGS